jgi:hypothetical protein
MNPTFTVEGTANKQPQPNGDVIRLRNWQPEAYKMADERLAIFNAAGSAGKTTLQIALAIHDHSKGRKQIVVTPQEIICQQFCKPMQIEVDGVVRSWAPRNLVGDTASLRTWLLTNSKDIVVTTHAALTLVFSSLSSKRQRTVFANTTLRIDESHHVLFSGDKTNKLGAVVKAACGTPSAHIHMTTATDFRTAGEILPADVRNDFKKYSLPFDILWQWLGIESFEHAWESYAVGTNPIAAILARIAVEPEEFHLIFVPHANKGWREGSPESLEALFNALRTIYKPDQILDLTQGDSQDDNKALLAAGDISRVKVVVSCEVGREGMTWSQCSRLHVTSEDQTPVRISQTLYRLFRPSPDKTKTVCCNYIPDFDVTAATKREHLTDANNAVLALLLDEEMFHPIAVEAPDSDSSTPRQTLQEIFGESYEDMKADLLMTVEAMSDLRTDLTSVLTTIIDDADILAEDRQRVRAALRRLVAVMKACRRPQMLKAIRGMDVAVMRTEAGFDKVVEDLRLNEICLHTTRSMTAETLIEYRKGIASINSMERKTLAETVLLAEKLTKDNGGLLPSATWLEANGHGCIRAAKIRNPETFTHIKQEKVNNSLTENVSIAEKLAKDNGGLLPPTSWLRTHGYRNVSHALHAYPKAFAHLKRQKLAKTLAEIVLLAEKLTKDNGGLLPSTDRLKAEKHHSVCNALYTYPKAFAHLARERKKTGKKRTQAKVA